MIDAYADEPDEFEKRRELWSAKHLIDEDVWAFVDRINELDEDLKENRRMYIDERERSKCTIFAKGLRDRAVGFELKQRMDEGRILELDEAAKFVCNLLKSNSET